MAAILFNLPGAISKMWRSLCPLRAVTFWSSIYRRFVDVRTLHSVPHSCLEWFLAKTGTWLKGPGHVGLSTTLAQIENIWPTMWCAAKKFGADDHGFQRTKRWSPDLSSSATYPVKSTVQEFLDQYSKYQTLKDGAVSFPSAGWHSTLLTLDLVCTFISFGKGKLGCWIKISWLSDNDYPPHLSTNWPDPVWSQGTKMDKVRLGPQTAAPTSAQRSVSTTLSHINLLRSTGSDLTERRTPAGQAEVDAVFHVIDSWCSSSGQSWKTVFLPDVKPFNLKLQTKFSSPSYLLVLTSPRHT